MGFFEAVENAAAVLHHGSMDQIIGQRELFSGSFHELWKGLWPCLALWSTLQAWLLRSSPKCTNWLQNYLSNRQIVVLAESTYSEPFHINAGVPQGSHLGPVLLTVFINDLLLSVPVPAEPYADDALLHQTLQLRQHNNDIEQLQRGLTADSARASSWKGRFGPDKTIIMTFSSSSAPPAKLYKQPLFINIWV